MRTYEALYIVKPELEDDDIQTVAKEVESLITSNDGAIVRSEIWGKRRLAYEVQKHIEGVYVLVRFQVEAPLIPRLDNHFRLTENVIRYLIVHFDEKTLRLEAEQNRRVEEEIRKSAARGNGDRDRDRDRDRDERPARARGGRRDDDDDEQEDDE